jgi:hypothetical protein
MALNQSPELRNSVFGTQPDANDTAEIGASGIMGKLSDALAMYGAPSPEIADVFARIHGRFIDIETLEGRSDTEKRLSDLRKDVIIQRAVTEIRAGLTAREAQQMTYISGLMGAPTSDVPLSAPDALAA